MALTESDNPVGHPLLLVESGQQVKKSHLKTMVHTGKYNAEFVARMEDILEVYTLHL